MKTLTNLISPFSTKTLHTDTYELVQNETVTNENYGDLIISGSLFSLTLFKNVSFNSCVFFGSKFENCEFSHCHFNNCLMQFSTFEASFFVATEFNNITWDLSRIKKSYLEDCFFDVKTSHFLLREDNHFKNCFNLPYILEEKLQKTESESETETRTLNMELEIFLQKVS